MNEINYQEYISGSAFGKISYLLKAVKIGLGVKLGQRVMKNYLDCLLWINAAIFPIQIPVFSLSTDSLLKKQGLDL